MASRGINKVIIIGNLGDDPKVTNLPDGSVIANFSVATSESWVDKATGNRQESTEWHRIVAFRRLAEIVAKYLRKGAKVYVEGKLQTRSWKDNTGVDRFTTEIVANELTMLGSHTEQDKSAEWSGDTNARTDSATDVNLGQVPPFKDDDFDDVPF